MANSSDSYQSHTLQLPTELRFIFISTGSREIPKMVQYAYISQFEGRNVFNLGFGDYDLETDEFQDSVNSNNGDVYKIFHTVLSTVPRFFERYPEDMIMVQGSDGRDNFSEECKNTCKRKCESNCKKLNKRINIYQAYVEKNFEKLTYDHWFLGGFKKSDTGITIELFVVGRQYDVIFMFKK